MRRVITFLGVVAGDGDAEDELVVVSAVMSAKRRVRRGEARLILSWVRWRTWEDWITLRKCWRENETTDRVLRLDARNIR
mmetsp:Transcript_15786/g.33406  ORF Transcript_15786/g.33406 Transcript_15786/m.33406 type:complete len:80 (+) Transcript_15786:1052-1291(+)